jgi:hypothetical protein
MKEMIPYIKYHDTDNRVFIELKKLATKITGEENVQGETIEDVLKVIATSLTGIEDIEGQTSAEILGILANNYIGGSSSEPTILYAKYNGDIAQVYYNEDYTNIVAFEDGPELFEKGPVVVYQQGYYYYITETGEGTNYTEGNGYYFHFKSGNKRFYTDVA